MAGANYSDVKRFREKRKARAIEAMGGCCQICGYNKHPKVMEFHHVDPTEKEKIKQHCRWEVWVQELKKCIMLCANCHREVHAGITELPEKYQIFDESLISEELKL